MKKWTFLAAVLMVVTFLVHVFVGGPDIYDPLRVSEMNAIPMATLSVVWHMISVILFLMSAALFYLSRGENEALYLFVLAACVGFAVLFIIYTLMDFGSLWALPQWVAFVAIAVIMLPQRLAR